MIDLDTARTPGGLSNEDLAGLARQVFLEITGQEEMNWDEIPEGTRENWRDAANVVFIHYLLETECTWEQLAEATSEKYHGKDSWKKQPLIMKFMWQAVVRHLANLISAEDADEVAEAKSADWKEWILETLHKEEMKDEG